MLTLLVVPAAPCPCLPSRIEPGQGRLADLPPPSWVGSLDLQRPNPAKGGHAPPTLRCPGFSPNTKGRHANLVDCLTFRPMG